MGTNRFVGQWKVARYSILSQKNCSPSRVLKITLTAQHTTETLVKTTVVCVDEFDCLFQN